MMANMATFSGVVVPGRGSARDHVSNSLDELSAITRQDLYPGSLNVVLDKALNLNSRYAATFDDGRRFIWKASVGGRQVWLYRWRGTPFNIVEVLADCKLREALGLDNGSRVDIVICDEVITPLSLANRLSSFVLWGLGRKHMYYSHEYPSNRKVMFIRKRMSDGQR